MLRCKLPGKEYRMTFHPRTGRLDIYGGRGRVDFEDFKAWLKAKSKFDSPGYKKAVAEFMRRHFSDLRVTPYDMIIGANNTEILRVMTGEPDAFTVTGNLASWNVVRKQKQIRVPTLVTVGARDLVTPACARTIHRGVRHSRLVIFRRSGHDALYKERDLYMETVRSFLDKVSH
jgi:proline iminopeptidase